MSINDSTMPNQKKIVNPIHESKLSGVVGANEDKFRQFLKAALNHPFPFPTSHGAFENFPGRASCLAYLAHPQSHQ